MKKFLVPALLVVAFVIYVAYQRMTGTSTGALAPSVTIPTTSTPIGSSTPVASSGSTPPPAPATPASQSSSKGKYKNGTYTGPVTDAFYGKIQVEAIIENGALADVQFLQYPDDQGESIQVSDRSMPILKSEAIKAQSAQVDVVSGATQTSQAFTQSLSAALVMAQN